MCSSEKLSRSNCDVAGVGLKDRDKKGAIWLLNLFLRERRERIERISRGEMSGKFGTFQFVPQLYREDVLSVYDICWGETAACGELINLDFLPPLESVALVEIPDLIPSH
ncbi:hypothetical protein AAC387_Pa03g3200 [Persea americana]